MGAGRRRPRKQGSKEGYDASPAPQEIGDLKRRSGETEDETERLSAANDNKTDSIAALNNTVKGLQDTIQVQRQEINALEGARVDLAGKVGELRQELNALKAVVDNKSGSGHGHPFSEITAKPSAYPPQTHGNDAHSPNFQPV